MRKQLFPIEKFSRFIDGAERITRVTFEMFKHKAVFAKGNIFSLEIAWPDHSMTKYFADQHAAHEYVKKFTF